MRRKHIKRSRDVPCVETVKFEHTKFRGAMRPLSMIACTTYHGIVHHIASNKRQNNDMQTQKTSPLKNIK